LVTETANPEITSAEKAVVKVQLEEDVLNADTEPTEADDTVASFVVPTFSAQTSLSYAILNCGLAVGQTITACASGASPLSIGFGSGWLCHSPAASQNTGGNPQSQSAPTTTLTSASLQTHGDFGYSAAASGNTVVVGAPEETSGGYSPAGNAYVFDAQNGALLRMLANPNPQNVPEASQKHSKLFGPHRARVWNSSEWTLFDWQGLIQGDWNCPSWFKRWHEHDLSIPV
jgi:hypothetical protein